MSSGKKKTSGIAGSLQTMGAITIPRMRHFDEEVGVKSALPGSVWCFKGAKVKVWCEGQITEHEADRNFGGTRDHGFCFKSDVDDSETWIIWHVYNNFKWEWLSKEGNGDKKAAELKRQAEMTSEPHRILNNFFKSNINHIFCLKCTCATCTSKKIMFSASIIALAATVEG